MNVRGTLGECQKYFRQMSGVQKDNVGCTLIRIYNSIGVMNTLTISCVREVVSINAPLVVSFAL